MTVHSNRSFTISWREDLTRNYVCYSAEWTAPGRKAAYMSFHSNRSSRTLTFKSEEDKVLLVTSPVGLKPFFFSFLKEI